MEVFKLCEVLTTVPVGNNFFEFDNCGCSRGHSLKLLEMHCSILTEGYRPIRESAEKRNSDNE